MSEHRKREQFVVPELGWDLDRGGSIIALIDQTTGQHLMVLNKPELVAFLRLMEKLLPRMQGVTEYPLKLISRGAFQELWEALYGLDRGDLCHSTDRPTGETDRLHICFSGIGISTDGWEL